ncbi:S10 family peptidase [Roseibacillus ishigakijimensis]|uniref:Peptidase S10 n=1 Tax=Roseibacillus ishigakijimensis TaxID=454146 RepID=A0A934RPR3_9BACT|nr:peptidase S10 [Roseibacillus ishigakijimensis]MBK1832854.1 peptidase S10 [Roseibacillus ishigakijimensis]
MKITTFALFTASCLILPLSAQEKDKKEEKKPESAEISLAPVEAEVEIAGATLSYTVTADTLVLKEDDGKERASVFHVSYVKKEEGDKDRPVMFAFNGGPGSSAVWLHLGALGPKLVPTSKDGTETLPPPVTLIDNPHSILDVTDLVFIDPVSTGYSRPKEDKTKGQFHGLNGDIESVADFIRRWTTENKRWSSPKYLLGESYGGIRAAGLAEHLQSEYGMSLNGVVMLSSLLDFRTLRASQGNYLMNQVYLPAMTAVAHHHGKISGDRDELLKQAYALAAGDYTRALFVGSRLSEGEVEAMAERLSALTGVPAALWVETNLRLSPTRYRRELLRAEGKVLGRFDARVAWPAQSKDSDYPSYDPSYAVAYGAFSTAMLAYLSEDLGGQDIHHPYRILTGKVHPWRWDAENSIVNVADRLQDAMTENPNLRLLVMGGYTDFATPPSGIEYTLDQLVDLPKESRERISYTYYEAGHMFYLNEPDIIKMRTDLVEFITGQSE